jgi:hypothetical protein
VKKPVISPLFVGHPSLAVQEGFRITWERDDGVIYTVRDKKARSAREAWHDSQDFFEKLGCTETPKGIPNEPT